MDQACAPATRHILTGRYQPAQAAEPAARIRPPRSYREPVLWIDHGAINIDASPGSSPDQDKNHWKQGQQDQNGPESP